MKSCLSHYPAHNAQTPNALLASEATRHPTMSGVFVAKTKARPA
jgi:hypothetical protein